MQEGDPEGAIATLRESIDSLDAATVELEKRPPDGDAVISQLFSIANTGSYSFGWDSFATGAVLDAVAGTVLPINGYNVGLSAVGGVSLFNADFLENPFGRLPIRSRSTLRPASTT